MHVQFWWIACIETQSEVVPSMEKCPLRPKVCSEVNMNILFITPLFMTKLFTKISGKLTDFKKSVTRHSKLFARKMGVTAMGSLYLDGQKYLSC